MNKIVLISCVSKKQSVTSRAAEMYISTLFNLKLQLARKLNPEFIFILSAKYGLITLDKIIEPYDQTLNKMSKVERVNWAKMVLKELRRQTNLQKDHFVILAGNRYREYLIPHFKYYEVPMEGLRIGQQLQFLKRQIENE